MIALLALEEFIPFDLAVPYSIFSCTSYLEDSGFSYDIFLCGYSATSQSKEWYISGIEPLSALSKADTIFIPGVLDPFNYNNEAIFSALRDAVFKGTRLVSICSGSIILAKAGLLDGLKAATHWVMSDDFAERYPSIDIGSNILFADNGQILTSAGFSAGIDICLHIIRQDYGVMTAKATADFLVMPLERNGTQPQRIYQDYPQSSYNLSSLLCWLTENIHLNHSLISIAQRACMSTRSLNRCFHQQLNVTPMTWLMMTRLRRAQGLLEDTNLTIKQIATTVGFNSAAVFRDSFKKAMGENPSIWRKIFINTKRAK